MKIKGKYDFLSSLDIGNIKQTSKDSSIYEFRKCRFKCFILLAWQRKTWDVKGRILIQYFKLESQPKIDKHSPGGVL